MKKSPENGWKFWVAFVCIFTISACGKDSTGREPATLPDRTPPALTAAAENPLSPSSRQVVTGKIEAGCRVSLSVDTGAHPGEVRFPSDTEWNCTIEGLAEGPNTVTVTAIDAAGNITEKVLTLFRDTTPPLITIEQTATPSALRDQVVGGMTEPGAMVTASLDELPPMSASLTGSLWRLPLSGLSEGSHTLVVTATDPAGNSATDSTTLIVDLTAPLLTLDPPSRPTSAREVTIGGTVEANVRIDVAVDTFAEIGEVRYHSSTDWECTLTALAEGANTVTVTATDAVGNQSVQTAIILRDTLPPTLTISPLSSPTRDQNIVLRGTVETDATLEVQIEFGGEVGEIVPHDHGEWECPISGLAEGENRIAVKALDSAGNWTLRSITVTRDTTPPVLTFDRYASPTARPDQTVGGMAESGAEVTVTIDGGSPLPALLSGGTWSREIRELADGEHTLTATAVDGAGNSASRSIEIVVDTTAPFLTLEPPASPTSAHEVILRGTREAGVTVEVAADTEVERGEVFCPAETEWECRISDLPEGVISITASAADALGNAASVSARLIVDRTAPLVLTVWPEAGRLDVPAETQLRVEFSENMDSATLGGSIRVTDPSGRPVTGSLAYETEIRTAVFTPLPPLAAATTYRAELAASIADLAGNSLGQGFSWSFTTLSSPPPLFVSTEGSDMNDGESPDTAFLTLQRGITAAADGRAVLVAPGLYRGEGNVRLNFGGKALVLRCADPPDCIVDGEGSAQLVHFQGGEGPATVVEGFTFQNGSSDYGGALRFSSGSSPTIRHCVVRDCTASQKGGGVDASASAPLLENLEISGCRAPNGGGIRAAGNGVVIRNCRIHGNTATEPVSGNGGGILAHSVAAVTIESCDVYGNEAMHGGGGISITAARGAIRRNRVHLNVAKTGANIHTRDGADVTIDYTLVFGGRIRRGTLTDYGGGLSAYNGARLTARNCTLSDNSLTEDGSGKYEIYSFGGSTIDLTNCIVRRSPGAKGTVNQEIPGEVTVRYSDMEGGYDGNGNMDADPLFSDPSSGNFTLLSGSPCRDAGTVVPGLHDRPDLTDLDGRPVDATPDLGAFEFY